MESRKYGSFDGWDDVWKEQSSVSVVNPIYCDDEPKTIYQFWQKGYAVDLLNLIRSKNYKTFCELGSGRGTTTMHLAKAGYEALTMVDLADEAFETARSSFAHYDLPIPSFVKANVEETDFEDESFDCIYNIGLLEHFEDPKPTLEESFRLLKTGGMIFMPIVPTMPYYKSAIFRLIFNPISVLKKIVKSVLGMKEEENKKIFRSDLQHGYYGEICKEIGYVEIVSHCYNPFPKVNNDGWVETNITLPVYRFLYKMFCARKNLTFASNCLLNTCTVLIAYKGKDQRIAYKS